MIDSTATLATRPYGEARLVPGVAVEVRTRFEEGTWARGFDVAAATPAGGYRIRRRADGTELPFEFPAGDVRTDRESPGTGPAAGGG